MNNRKLASQTIRALHKENAGGGGEVWENVDFTGGEVLALDQFTDIELPFNAESKTLRVTATLSIAIETDNKELFSKVTSNTFVKGGAISLTMMGDAGESLVVVNIPISVLGNELSAYMSSDAFPDFIPIAEFNDILKVSITKIEMLEE